MDLNEFKEKVFLIEKKTKSLINVVENQNYVQFLENFLNALYILVDFVKDDSNLLVLQNYIKKESKNVDVCPLDNLCKNLLQRLNTINGLLNEDIFEFIITGNNSPEEILNLTDVLQDYSIVSVLSVYEVLKHLDGHKKTLVILGPNGSGKTSFANYAKQLESHIKVIPASKPIRAIGRIPALYKSTLDNFNSELYSEILPNEDLLQKLIIGLCTEHDDIARNYFDSDIKKESTFQKVKKIFDVFFDVKLNNSAFAAKEMKVQKDERPVFDFNEMSDGERVAFFYIATVVAAPKQSFIIVDEPENHLNPAIYNKIWDKLISTRSDRWRVGRWR